MLHATYQSFTCREVVAPAGFCEAEGERFTVTPKPLPLGGSHKELSFLIFLLCKSKATPPKAELFLPSHTRNEDYRMKSFRRAKAPRPSHFTPPPGFLSWIDSLPFRQGQDELNHFKLYGQVRNHVEFRNFRALLA